MLYYSLIYSLLAYGIVAWGHGAKTLTLQKKNCNRQLYATKDIKSTLAIHSRNNLIPKRKIVTVL
jgi:hypothetical protein